MTVNKKLVGNFINGVHGGDPQRAIEAINKALGTNHNKYRLTEWRSGVTPLPARTRELMRYDVIEHHFDPATTRQLTWLLGIEQLPKQCVDTSDDR